MKIRAVTMSLALLSVALLSGCKDQGRNPVALNDLGPQYDHSKGHKGQKGGGNSPSENTPLTVTFGHRADDRITSDGGGVYSDGVDFVVAHLRPPGIGAFIFETAEGVAGKNGPQPIRFVCVDFRGAAGQGKPPFGFDCVDVYANTPGGEGELDFHTMEVDGSASESTFQIFWKDQDYEWYLRYDGFCGKYSANGFPVTITHPTVDRWTIEGTNALLCKRPLKGKTTWTKAGDFTMPFRLTLQVTQ